MTTVLISRLSTVTELIISEISAYVHKYLFMNGGFHTRYQWQNNNIMRQLLCEPKQFYSIGTDSILLIHIHVNGCVYVFECEWIRAVVTGSQFLSIVLPCVDFLRSPFSIRFAKHSVEILSSIRLKVLLGISQIRTIKKSNQAFSHWI